MSDVGKLVNREVRNNLDRFTNWPLQRTISLGQIGHYNGRNATVDWITSLGDLHVEGIDEATQGMMAMAHMDEIYTTTDDVSFRFTVDNDSNINSVEVNFSKARSICAQGYHMTHQRLAIRPLQQQLSLKIREGEIEWDRTWVILTELWQSEAFTTMVAGASNSKTILTTRADLAEPRFNIANPELNLQISFCSKMSYVAVAEERVSPYFKLHKLVLDRYGGFDLKPYGRSLLSRSFRTVEERPEYPAQLQDLLASFNNGTADSGPVRTPVVNSVKSLVANLLRRRCRIAGTVTEDGILVLETRLPSEIQLFIEVDRDGELEASTFEPGVGIRPLGVATGPDLEAELITGNLN